MNWRACNKYNDNARGLPAVLSSFSPVNRPAFDINRRQHINFYNDSRALLAEYGAALLLA